MENTRRTAFSALIALLLIPTSQMRDVGTQISLLLGDGHFFFPPPAQLHSSRSTWVGSTRAARMAGTSDASSATRKINSATLT